MSLVPVDWKVVLQLLWRMKDRGAPWVGADDGWSPTVKEVMARQVGFHLMKCEEPG